MTIKAILGKVVTITVIYIYLFIFISKGETGTLFTVFR